VGDFASERGEGWVEGWGFGLNGGVDSRGQIEVVWEADTGGK
jgi:hypothetical protein